MKFPVSTLEKSVFKSFYVCRCCRKVPAHVSGSEGAVEEEKVEEEEEEEEEVEEGGENEKEEEEERE